jgi:biopolymer transport protein ExbD
MHIHRQPAAEDEGIPMTPLIDCVFLLLIFFLTATSFHRKERDIKVNPPQASEAKAETPREREITVNVRSEEDGGFLVVSGRILSLDELTRMLTDAARANPHVVVNIRGDKRSYHQRVVDVLNACKKAHVANYVIATTYVQQE